MFLRRNLFALTLTVSLAAGESTQAAQPADGDFFVAPDGNNSWSGRLPTPRPDGSDGPLATLAGARDAVRRLKAEEALKQPVRVLLRGGTYRLSEPVVFAAEDSGTKEAPITYAAYPDERPVLSGGVPIAGWEKTVVGGDSVGDQAGLSQSPSETPPTLWTTVIPAVKEGRWYFRQLFVNGERCIPARIPNGDVYQMAGPMQPLTDRNAARREENNVVYRTKDGCFHQHYGRENILRNNILAFSATRGQIIRSREEEHRSFTFERNIVYCQPAPPLGGNWGNGNYVLDHNIYWATGEQPKFPGGLSLKQWQEKGHDTHSVIADPQCADPGKFDFRLQEDSPALKLGFRPIDLSTVGLSGPTEWIELPKKIKRPAMKLPGEE